jgi:hypothetical protein
LTLRNARAINDKVRLLAKLGAALLQARNSGAELNDAVAASVGWDKLARHVAAERQDRDCPCRAGICQ